jgi:hypothetical protein
LETLDVRAVRRLALARAGLAGARLSGLPARAAGGGARARSAAHAVIGRTGYLQLDTVSVAGARAHGLVLLARLEGMDAGLTERLLVPGAPLFEYWGHAACWMPLDLYPLFGFRRRGYRKHPWWGDILGRDPALARDLLRRARDEGPFRASDLEGKRRTDWWGGKPAKQVAEALWSSGELAIRERRGFQRIYDLAERVIPAALREREVPEEQALRALILLALDGHGWAEERTIAATWNLRKTRPAFRAALASLAEEKAVVPCALRGAGGEERRGWIRPRDLEAAEALRRWRPRPDRGVLLTPFDPLLWDRERVRTLFGFDQVLEIYVPAARRRFGYYCMPVLAGERLVARVDVKADRGAGRLRVPALHHEDGRAGDRAAVAHALRRHADALGLALDGKPAGA